MKSYLPCKDVSLSFDLAKTTLFTARAWQFSLASFSIESETLASHRAKNWVRKKRFS
ncbi:MAG: hypothetical protein ACI9X0_000728 [Kiritimatiellia bacterium]|jgi:hypothetical protein